MSLGTPRTVASVGLLVAGLRAGGARIGMRDVVRARRALAAGAEPYYALRRTLCRRPADFVAFDDAFAVWFGDARTGLPVERG